MDLIQKAINKGFILKNKDHYLWEIQKWLRVNHNIHVSPRESWVFDNTLEYVCTVNGTHVSHGIKDKPINRFDTYEQALEVGLQEGLKLIK